MQSDDEIISVVQAHKQGKKIAFRPFGAFGWMDVITPEWNFQGCEYRVADEPRKPREWAVMVSADGAIITAHLILPGYNVAGNLIRVREIPK